MQPRSPAPIGASLTAALLALGLLALWRLLYPISDAAMLLLLAMVLLIWRGSYRRAMARRITWRHAVLRQDSWLISVFLGRVPAHLVSLGTALLATLGLADYALTASLAGMALAAVFCVVTALVLSLVCDLAKRHARQALVLVVASPIAVGIAGSLGTVAFFWLGWQIEPAPPEADAPSLAAAIAQAQTALPARDHVIAWLLGVPRSLETAGWVLARQAESLEFSPFGLIILLSYNALISFALARFVVDVVAAAHEPTDQNET